MEKEQKISLFRIKIKSNDSLTKDENEGQQEKEQEGDEGNEKTE